MPSGSRTSCDEDVATIYELTDKRQPTENNGDSLRWALGAVLGGLVALLPLLTGGLDASTTAIVSVIAAFAILPVGRHAGAPLNKPVALLPLLELMFGPALAAHFFSIGGGITFMGAWFLALGVIRLAAGWQDEP